MLYNMLPMGILFRLPFSIIAVLRNLFYFLIRECLSTQFLGHSIKKFSLLFPHLPQIGLSIKLQS